MNRIKENESLISIHDLNFISDKTKLAPEKAALLLQEPRDLNLVIDSIADQEIVENDTILTLSFDFFTKLCIFKASKKTGFDIEEKAYVSHCVSTQFPKLDAGPVPSKIVIGNEETCSFYLVLLGFFPERLDRPRRISVSRNWLANKVSECYRSLGKRDVSNHLPTWISLLQQIKKNGWV